MDEVLIPTIYAQRLSAYLQGESLYPLLALFDEHAVIERYIYGEPPRKHVGIEQIEESLLRLPPIGGSFHVVDVHVDERTVHARFYTRGFAFPLRGMYRFELTPGGRIARLYIAARYHPEEEQP
ncbi:MAG: hypothetical protein JXA09_13865 [Anaerolineae bacterium]|nr:hypothetical protein [Anaerolineae bacterium]